MCLRAEDGCVSGWVVGLGLILSGVGVCLVWGCAASRVYRRERRYRAEALALVDEFWEDEKMQNG